MPPEQPLTSHAESLSLHPIQLEFVAVRELTIKVKAPPTKTYELPEGSLELGGSVSAFDEVSRKFQATATAVIGHPDLKNSTLPFYLKVELVGGFAVQNKSLGTHQVMAWAQRAAQFTLVPYLREQVASLSARAGFSSVLIPLIQIPTERVRVSSPSPEEIDFAQVRSTLQEKLWKAMDAVIEASGFDDRGGGGRLESPEGYISPVTLRGQRLRLYKSYRDKHEAEYRIEAIIGHTENWRATVSLFTDVGSSKFLIISRADEIDDVVQQARDFFKNSITSGGSASTISHTWVIEWPDKTSLAAMLNTRETDPDAPTVVYWRGEVDRVPSPLARSTPTELATYMERVAAETGGKLLQLSPK